MERTHGQAVWISMARKTRQCNHGKGMSFIQKEVIMTQKNRCVVENFMICAVKN